MTYLVCIGHILRQILDHELLGFTLHISTDEAGQVQVGPAIEVQFVFEHLMHSVCWRSRLGDLELGNFLLRGIPGGVGSDG